MKKLFAILMAVALAMVALTAVAEGTTDATNENIEKDEYGNVVIVEDVDLDEVSPDKEDLYTEDDGDYPIPLEDGEDLYTEAEPEDEIVEWVDLDEEGDEESAYTESDDKPPFYGEVVLPEPDGTYIQFPVIYCEITDTTPELEGPGLEYGEVCKRHKKEVVSVIDISNEDWWLLEDGNYISVDNLEMKEDYWVPGELEMQLDLDETKPLDVHMVLAGPARSEEDLVEEYHSLIIYNVGEKKLRVFKYGIETLDVDLSEATWLSPIYPYWTITEEFTEEGIAACSVQEIVEQIYRYSLPGSYLVIFP